MSGALLDVDNLTRVFTTRRGLTSERLIAVDRARLFLPADQHLILAIAGESGSGKTTLARMILGLVEPTSGRLTFKGRDVRRLGASERRAWLRREIQPVFQDPFATFNPLRKVESYLYDTAGHFGSTRRGGDRHLVVQSALADVESALADVGLSLDEIRGRYPNELSGGQLQRASIARALISRPSLLVADEPVSMLDASLRMSVLNLFKELKHRQSVIYITHDLATAYYASDRIAIMLGGWIVEDGPVEQVLDAPLHPYTVLLKTSVLAPDPRAARRERVSPVVCDTVESSPVGCRFAHRCPDVMDVCRTTEPAAVAVDGRSVKCHLYGSAQ